MQQPYISIAARIAVDLDLFKHIASSPSAVTSSQLARASGGDQTLICESNGINRIMKVSDKHLS